MRGQAEQRLDLLAFLAQLLEFALHAAFQQQPRAGADAPLIAIPLPVAERPARGRGSVFALQSEPRAERPPPPSSIRFAQPPFPRLAARGDAEGGGGVEAANHVGEGHPFRSARLVEKDWRNQMSNFWQTQGTKWSDLDVPERRQAA